MYFSLSKKKVCLCLASVNSNSCEWGKGIIIRYYCNRLCLTFHKQCCQRGIWRSIIKLACASIENMLQTKKVYSVAQVVQIASPKLPEVYRKTQLLYVSL